MTKRKETNKQILYRIEKKMDESTIFAFFSIGLALVGFGVTIVFFLGYLIGWLVIATGGIYEIYSVYRAILYLDKKGYDKK